MARTLTLTMASALLLALALALTSTLALALTSTLALAMQVGVRRRTAALDTAYDACVQRLHASCAESVALRRASHATAANIATTAAGEQHDLPVPTGSSEPQPQPPPPPPPAAGEAPPPPPPRAATTATPQSRAALPPPPDVRRPPRRPADRRPHASHAPQPQPPGSWGMVVGHGIRPDPPGPARTRPEPPAGVARIRPGSAPADSSRRGASAPASSRSAGPLLQRAPAASDAKAEAGAGVEAPLVAEPRAFSDTAHVEQMAHAPAYDLHAV